jgi:predicted PurR-regulated permease PerM
VYKSTLKIKKMNAKKFFRLASLVILIAIALPASSAIIVPGSSQTNSAAKNENPRAQQLIQRLEDIRGMNKSELTRMEKKSLRKEVKEIKKEMKTMSGGVYLSVGAILIVILLLILLL